MLVKHKQWSPVNLANQYTKRTVKRQVLSFFSFVLGYSLKILWFWPQNDPKTIFCFPPFISDRWKIVTDKITDNSPGPLARAVSVCSGRPQEDQHTVPRHHDIFLPGGDRRIFELAQRLLDLLFRFHQGRFHCTGLNLYFRKVRRKGFASLGCDS